MDPAFPIVRPIPIGRPREESQRQIIHRRFSAHYFDCLRFSVSLC